MSVQLSRALIDDLMDVYVDRREECDAGEPEVHRVKGRKFW